jgi:hypothetical protein
MEFRSMLFKVFGPCEITAFMTFPIIKGRKRAGECFMVNMIRAIVTFLFSESKILSSVRNGFDLRKLSLSEENCFSVTMKLSSKN